MYLTADPSSILQKRRASGSPPVFDERPAEQKLYGIKFSPESQIQLNDLREYMAQCRSVLDEIKADLCRAKRDHEDSDLLSEAAVRLCRFCMEADGRGFGCLYQVAFELQKALLHPDGCRNRVGFWEAVHKSLFILSALVEQCEIDFRKCAAVQDAIECLRQVSV